MKSYIKTGSLVFLVMIMLVSLSSCSGFSIRSVENINKIDEIIIEAYGDLTWSCGDVPEEDRDKIYSFC